MKLTHRPVPLVLLVAMTAVLAPWPSGGLRAQGPVAAPGQASAQAGALQRLLDAELSRIPAKAGIWVRHLKTGEQASVNGDERFNSASVIKIPVMVMAYQMAEAGRSSSPAPAPTFAAAVPSAPPQAATQTQGQPPVQSPAQPPQGPAVSAQELSRLAAEVARLREELKARPPEQGPATRPASPAQVAPTGARRLALVIGNDGYRSVPRLLNAQTDARAMGDLLTRLGYRVRVRTDLSERAMKDELRAFKAEVQGGDEVLFFFAGHGVQLSGANYLLPTDIRGDSEDQVRDDALPLQKVLDDLQERKARFALAIVDACRDNPFKGVAGRSIGTRGLAPTTAATGQMVMFSAGAGQQALDRLNDRDRDPNGLFTRVLLKELEKPGVSVDRVLRTVRSQVVEMARAVGHEQVPALYDQTVGEFYFRH